MLSLAIHDSQATIHYTYDGDQVIAEYEGGSLKRKFIYGPGIDEPICMISSGVTYYYHFDGLGSVAAISDDGGQMTERYSYDVFGEPNRVSDVNNPYMFTGRRYDPEMGLYYYRARYYARAIGRFLQTDPMGHEDGMNLYVYVKNNPIKDVDPYGLITSSECYDIYRKNIAEILKDEAECHRDCGVLPVGPETPGCVALCWKTGVYFPVCYAACETVFWLAKAACHHLCSELGSMYASTVRDARDRCLDRACD